jgi:hypothetical protein
MIKGNKLMEKPNTLDDLKITLTKTPFAVFGAGPLGGRIWGACRSIGCAPVGFCDNYKTGVDNLSGLPVFSPKHYVENYPEGVLLISIQSQEKIKDVSTQFQQLGFAADQMIFFDEIIRLFETFEFSWSNSREEEFDWRKNNEIIEYLAKWIDSTDISIADLGCGKEMHLKSILSAGCKYIPVDYLSRSNDTIVCDFNSTNLPDLKVDVVFACGVLMYLKDPIRFLNWICDIAKKVIIRFAPFDHLSAKEKFTGHVSCSTVALVESTIIEKGFQITRKELTFERNREYAYLCFEKI